MIRLLLQRPLLGEALFYILVLGIARWVGT
jgi:hypothetical protein